MPEELLTPKKSLKQLEKENKRLKDYMKAIFEAIKNFFRQSIMPMPERY